MYNRHKERDIASLLISSSLSNPASPPELEPYARASEEAPLSLLNMLFQRELNPHQRFITTKWYIVQKKDTLADVAERFNVTVDDLMRHNQLSMRSSIEKRVLEIPIIDKKT